MRAGTIFLGIIGFSVGIASPALAQRFPFERSFDITGPSVLDVSTMRGKIEVTVGEPGRVVVAGTATVRVDWNVPANAVDLARRVADNPPIQRDGQTLRLRPPADPTEQGAVTVSYQVRVPPETEVASSSDSGATVVRSVTGPVVIHTQSGAIDVMQLGGGAVVTTGSGAFTADGVAGSLSVTTSSSGITAHAVAGDFRARTGSGEVEAVLTGEGNVDVETGSSAIRLSGIRGAVAATSRSGRVTLRGVPGRDWVASVGSSSIELITESSVPLSIEASSGSSVKITGAAVQGSVAKRKVVGSVSGGGPLLKMTSRSGSVVIRLFEPTSHR